MSESETRDDSLNDDVFNDLESFLEQTTDQIGPYKILGRLGEGGFGVVYEAEQEKPVRRRVALKVIKPGMDSKQVIARFEAERQALALMDHPNIAKVFGGGLTERGLPYFVMERINGEAITEFCDRHRLTISERLELLIPVCHAIQHAHAKGVIHRDIKPGNILVGYDSEGKSHATVIDFGVAKALNQQLTEKTIFTSQGQMIGTPQYMSPEQAEMSGIDIDTRTDVYSIGVVLYELLTGMLPFEAKDLRGKMYGEMQRIIRESDVPRPSTRLRSALSHMTERNEAVESASKRHLSESELPKRLHGELDWVVMKCLEKNRDRRYPTPTAVADELEHYLNNEPVLARPPTVSYRLSKLVKRNKGSFVASAVFVLILLVATGVSMRFWIVADRERKRAELALDDRNQALTEAQQSLETAQERLGQIQSLVRIYSDYEYQIRRIEGATAARGRLADTTIDILDQLGSEMGTEPWIESELANGYLSIGLINSVRNEEFSQTINAFQRSKEIFRTLSIANPQDQSFILGEVQATIGLALAVSGHERLDDAMGLALEAERKARSVTPLPEQRVLKDQLVARSVLVQANLELLGQNYRGAGILIDRVLESPFVMGSDAEKPVKTLEIEADTLRARGNMYRELGEMDQAIEMFESAIDLRRRGVELYVSDAVLRRGLIHDLYWLGRIYAFDAKLPERAIAIYRESLAHAERLRGADPLDGRAYELVLDQRKSLATALRRSGQIDLARVEAELLLSSARDFAAQDPMNRLRQRRVVAVQFDQARVLYQDAMRALKDPDRTDEAEALLIQSVGVFDECSEFYMGLIDNDPLGTYDKYRIDAAEVELQRGYTIEKLGLVQNDPLVRQSAIEHYLRAAELYNSHGISSQLAEDQIRNLSISYRNIGTIALSIPDGEQAVKYLELADTILRRDHWSVFARKAEAYRLVGDEVKAREFVQRAFDALEELPEPARQNARLQVQSVLDALD